MTILRENPWHLNEHGLLSAAGFIPSPNCDLRPTDCAIELIVIHAISLPPDQFGGTDVEALFTNTLNPQADPFYPEIATLRVSAHFYIKRSGELLQFVPTNLRAWHAGASEWRGRSRCNDFSLGIELEGCDTRPFTRMQYLSLTRLVATLKAHYPIGDITGHQNIAPNRKTDPGPFFDWTRFFQTLKKTKAG